MQQSEKTLLVTGGAGFIGANFVRYIRQKYPEYKILVLDALTYAGSIDNLPEHNGSIAFWYGNVCNANLVDMLVEQSNIVVHFAAETHVTRSIYDNYQFFQTDVIGTQTVINAALKNIGQVERLIHVSTSEVYGTALAAAITEEHPLNPMSPYASAKCGADRLVYSYMATYGVPAIIVRPFNNFGRRQHLEKVVPRFITSALLGEALTVHGNGDAARDFVHVDDTCRAIDLIMHAPVAKVTGEVFNIATGKERRIRQVAEDVVRLSGAKATPIIHIGDRPGQVARHTGDASKIKRKLGWTPRVDWEKGLQQTIEWYRQNRDWWQKQMWMRHIKITTAAGRTEFH